MFVSVHQIFKIWFVPFYEADVRLLVKLHLRQLEDKKFYIQSQEDFYQINDLVKFFFPFGTAMMIGVIQLLATLGCMVGAWVFAPLTWYYEQSMNADEEKTRRP